MLFIFLLYPFFCECKGTKNNSGLKSLEKTRNQINAIGSNEYEFGVKHLFFRLICVL